MKYYLKTANNEDILSFNMRMYPEDFIILDDTQIINENLLPSFFDGIDNIEQKLDIYFHALSNEPVKHLNLLEIDDYIVQELELDDLIRNNGRLFGLLYVVCYIKTHFKDKKHKIYVTPAYPQTISFISLFGWDKLFLDVPITWEELKCF